MLGAVFPPGVRTFATAPPAGGSDDNAATPRKTGRCVAFLRVRVSEGGYPGSIPQIECRPVAGNAGNGG